MCTGRTSGVFDPLQITWILYAALTGRDFAEVRGDDRLGGTDSSLAFGAPVAISGPRVYKPGPSVHTLNGSHP